MFGGVVVKQCEFRVSRVAMILSNPILICTLDKEVWNRVVWLKTFIGSLCHYKNLRLQFHESEAFILYTTHSEQKSFLVLIRKYFWLIVETKTNRTNKLNSQTSYLHIEGDCSTWLIFLKQPVALSGEFVPFKKFSQTNFKKVFLNSRVSR